jgi:hypothetical protein
MEKITTKITLKVCSNCKKIPTKAKRCSSCKRHFFCNRDCQVTYWKKSHKRLCKWTKNAKRNDLVVVHFNPNDPKMKPEWMFGKILKFPCETDTGTFDIMISEEEQITMKLADENKLQTTWEAYGQEWNKGATLFDTLVTTTINPLKIYLQSMSHFQSSIKTLKSIVLNTCDTFSDLKKCNELVAERSLFMGYCWSDYNDKTSAIHRLRDAIAHATSPVTLKDAYLELLMVYEENFQMIDAKNLINESINDSRYKSMWTNPHQRPGHIASCRKLTAKPWWSGKTKEEEIKVQNMFPFINVLESNYNIILSEFNNIRKYKNSMHDVGDHKLRETEDARVVDGQGWKETVLFGINAEPHLAPKTVQILKSCVMKESIDLCNSGGGEIIFSYLFGNTIIKPHCAATNHRLTCHLGLIIPSKSKNGKCSITVCGEERYWSNGKCLIFDDSFEHEVSNTTNEHRGILLLRFWHPELISKKNREDSYNECMQERKRQHERRFNACVSEKV